MSYFCCFSLPLLPIISCPVIATVYLKFLIQFLTGRGGTKTVTVGRRFWVFYSKNTNQFCSFSESFLVSRFNRKVSHRFFISPRYISLIRCHRKRSLTNFGILDQLKGRYLAGLSRCARKKWYFFLLFNTECNLLCNIEKDGKWKPPKLNLVNEFL